MNKHLILIVLSALIFIGCNKKSDTVFAQTSNTNYITETVVDDLKSPWSMTFLPNGALLITEINGALIHFKDGKKTEIKGVPEVYRKGQGGLLDIEIHPDYKNNGWIYFSYATSEGDSQKGGNTAIMRAKLSDNSLVEKEVLYKGSPNTESNNHFGSRLCFDNDGYLYFSIGDRFDRDTNPQDLTKDGGKIYRINDDGSIPEDNPFIDSPSAKKAIYSYGHRNPQGMTLHPTTGKIWTHEHGPKGGDEINIIKPGVNYGWPLATYGVNYSGTKITDNTELEGMESPLHYWVPSIAPSGMTFVTSDKYPDLRGNLLVGSLKFQYVNRCIIENNRVVKEEKLFENIGRVRSVKQAPDGYIYIAVDGKGIFRIVSK